MSGYTPLFSSLTTGTLCGKWPDIGLWPIVLSLCDRHGVVDVTPAYIASVTGLALDEVVTCMKRFCEPDPYSRTGTLGGARLELIDTHRDWGWRVVNHDMYREKARLKAKAEREVREGLNAARMQDRRSYDKAHEAPTEPPPTAADRHGPPLTAADPLSNTNTNSKSKRALKRPSRIVPDDFDPDASWAKAQLPDLDVQAEIVKFREWEFKSAHSDWSRTWRRWIRTCKESGRYARTQQFRVVV